jgi:glycosyltransferase involved in cell wall biosynthesis
MMTPPHDESHLRVVLSVQGVFHHFELASELHAQGKLERIYSTFPWVRLKREPVPRHMVQTFPLIHGTQMLLSRKGIGLPQQLSWFLDYARVETFDRWVAKRIPDCDVFVALSGCGLITGKVVKEREGKYVCDRCSTHIRYQDQILTEEYRRWGLETKAVDPRIVRREEAEYALADAITVPSEFVRQSFVEMGVPAAKVRKIPFGVNLQRFTPVGEPPSDTFEVVFVGQVNFRKGIPYLLDAFRTFSHPRKRLRIIGPVAREIQSFLGQHLPDNTEVLGAIPQSELKQVMSTSNVLVLPSIEEGLAFVQGQAMACGCPVISTTNSGGSDLFTNGVEGFEVPIRSAEAIREKLVQLADSPQLQAQMRTAAIERVKSLGGWRDYGGHYIALLNDLVSA